MATLTQLQTVQAKNVELPVHWPQIHVHYVQKVYLQSMVLNHFQSIKGR